jgi:hypothetical protein
MRRAEPRSAEDIGTWHAILEVTSIFAIFINSGLVAFTATNLVNYTWPMRVWTFILMSGGIFALRGFVAFAIPDTPEWVNIQVTTTRYVLTWHLSVLVSRITSCCQALICARARISFLTRLAATNLTFCTHVLYNVLP